MMIDSNIPAGMDLIGWDIGGANIKAVHLGHGGLRIIQRPFPIWEARDTLPDVLAGIAAQFSPPTCAGVTITAELSDAFRSKRQGITFVLDALEAIMPDGVPLHVFGSDGQFHEPKTAREFPLLVAAANWMATASLLARNCANCLLVDIGSTTTDVIPIVNGLVVARGRDDPSRLIHGELFYTGALRTNVASIVQRVPLWGYWCPVSAEYFATTQDVYLLLGELQPQDCSSPTADGRPATLPFAAERLARVVCADTEMLGSDEIEAIARHIAVEHARQIIGAISQVRARNDVSGPLVASGAGAFLVQAAANQLGIPCHSFLDALGQSLPAWAGEAASVEGINAAVAAPAFALALLLRGECHV